MTFSITKDPDSTIDYTMDWTDFLGGAATISTSTWIAETGLDLGLSTHDDTTASVRVSGGVFNRSHELVNRIETNNAQIFERTIFVIIDQL